MAKTANLTNERKYEIADILYEAYADQVTPEYLEEDSNRKHFFGILLHTPNANGIELIDACPATVKGTNGNPDSTDAMHIANLTIRRFGNHIAIRTANF